MAKIRPDSRPALCPARHGRLRTALVVILAASVAAPIAQKRSVDVTSPRDQFGHDIGDDYLLVNYTQYEQYLHKLDRESDRVKVVDIGKTAEGRTEYTAIITSGENHRNLAKYKDINRRLALAETLTDDRARQLAREGKVVVWIDGGLHATEVLGAQQLIEIIYRLSSRTDQETLRILDDVIVLCTLVNPDGMELVSNWYMRDPDVRKRSTSGLPRLYQKYIGHDNNRDFYMMNQPESENANRMMYREWFPAIMYNHHQTGPAGTVLFAPPFRDPFNYNFDPLIPLGIDLVGSAIHTRLAVEGKPGAVMRSGASYSTWFNGGIRTTSYFHNQIGILTEMIGHPTPVQIPFVPEMQLPRGDAPNPIAPQTWHFRQSIEYSMTTNLAVLDIASKRKEDFLFNMYRMGKNAIEKGSRDSWTIHPRRIDSVKAAAGGADRRGAVPAELYESVLRDPRMRDARGYILPSDQRDFLTATKFVNILIRAGVVVHRATRRFAVNGTEYPAGSFVVKAAQAFRPHVLDMFEPQVHPDDIPYPGAPPRAPYDVAGYTLSYSMGVKFDRVLDGFDGPFERLPDVVTPPRGTIERAPEGGGYLLSHQVNDAFVAVNRLLKAGEDVYWLESETLVGGRRHGPGTMFVPARRPTFDVLRRLAAEKGLSFDAVASRPSGEAMQLNPVRIGLWDQYGGSMPSGWTRWLLEQFEFPFEVVYPKTLDAGNLGARFDVLIFVDGAIPARPAAPAGQPPAASIPPEFRDRLGSISVDRTVPALRRFVEEGGTLVAIGSSTAVARHFGLPVQNALVERAGDAEIALPPEKFFVPGSLLEARVDTTHPLGYGVDDPVHVFFDHSEAFRLLPEAEAAGVRRVAWFGSRTPLRSGWAWGQHYLDQAVVILDAPLGKGRTVLMGPEVVWRAQPHGTFKFLFNAIYCGGAR
jgi:hypothetical protein